MKKSLVFIFVFLVCIGIFTFMYIRSVNGKKEEENQSIKQEVQKSKNNVINDIKKHYGTYVKTSKEATLYTYAKGNYTKVGKVAGEQEYTLKKKDSFNETDVYFEIEEIPYYVFYQEVIPIDKLTTTNMDYKNYIPFPESIVTKKTRLYNGQALIYDLEESMTFPILVKEDNEYYVTYNNHLYSVKKEDVEKNVPSQTTGEIATSMSVMNYHFFYDTGMNCNEIICLSQNKFQEQLKYLSDNQYYTPTMKEFEWFMDKKIQLPKKSVFLTVDDGGMGTDTVLPQQLEKYNKRASLFLITGFNDKNKFKSPTVELHSHSNLLHTAGACPGGQGGGIKCLAEERVISDLRRTRDLLNGTTAFAYPFYEYNNRSIELLKKAGFTMAFIGGNKRAVPGTNKMTIPRYPILSTITIKEFVKKVG